MNTDLYIKPVEFEKVSYKRVSENPADWTGNIMETFYNQFPYFAQTSVSVTLTQKDEAKGYGLGQIMIEEGTGMVVPIIIQNYELFPFDIAIVNGITMPLTNTTLNLYVQGRGAFLKVVKPEAGDITNSLFNTGFSQQIVPSYVTESYKQASAKEESMIEYIRMQLKAAQAVKAQNTGRTIGAVVGTLATGTAQGGVAGATVGYGAQSLAKDPALFEDHVLDRMQKESLTGGQMKADQLFHEAEERYKMSNKKNDLYIMLCFRKWAVEQGIETKHWDIPGFEKTGEKEESKKDEKKESKEHESKESKKEEKEEHEEMSKKDKKEDAKEKEKKASLIDRIAPTVTQQMKDSFFDQIQKSASLLEGFKRNGTSDLLLKLAKINPEAIDFKERVRKELDRDLHYIYKTGSHEWKMILGSSRVNDPVEITIDDVAAGKIEHVKTSAVYEKSIEKYAATKYVFTTGDGNSYAMFEDNTYTEIPAYYHIKVAGNVGKSETVVTAPEITKTATWRVGNEHLPLFEVTRVWKDNGREKIEANTGLSKTAFVRMKGIDAPYTDKGITYLPIDAQFIKVGTRVEVPEKHVDIYANGNAVYRADDFTYVLRGHTFEEFNKTASADTTLDKALWTTLQLGGTKDDVHAIGQLKVGESYPILHSLNIPISFDKVASKWDAEFTATSKNIRTAAHRLVKEASALTDIPTVDAVLALNFVNKNNIQQFAESAHELLHCSQTLASMLLHTRLGVRVVEEATIRRVMLGLIDIVEVLQGIGNLAGKK